MNRLTSGGSGASGAVETTKKAASSRIGQILAALGVTAGGYTFLDNPQGFILYVVLDAVVGLVQGIAGALGFQAANLWRELGDILVGTFGAALGEPGRAVAQLIIDAVLIVDNGVQDAAAQAGPFGLLASILAWLFVMLTVTYSAVALWNGYKWVRTVVV